jgi:hypothetical protein
MWICLAQGMGQKQSLVNLEMKHFHVKDESAEWQFLKENCAFIELGLCEVITICSLVEDY